MNKDVAIFNKMELMEMFQMYLNCDCDHCKEKINETLRSLKQGKTVKVTLSPDYHHLEIKQIHIS